MGNPTLVMGILIFAFFLSVVCALITNTQFNLLSPITLTLISVPLLAVISASNTPVVKGVSMAVFFGILGTFFAFSGLPIEIFGIVIVPLFIGLGLALAEIGQG